MSTILASEFVWGTIIGLILSVIGGFLQVRYTVSINQIMQKRTLISFLIDEINNIQGIISELDRERSNGGAINDNHLALLDIELGLYSRNREHIIHLPPDLRAGVRSFMNEIAIKRAVAQNNLAEFYVKNKQENDLRAENRAEEADKVLADVLIHIRSAHEACERLVRIANSGYGILESLAKLK